MLKIKYSHYAAVSLLAFDDEKNAGISLSEFVHQIKVIFYALPL